MMHAAPATAPTRTSRGGGPGGTTDESAAPAAAAASSSTTQKTPLPLQQQQQQPNNQPHTSRRRRLTVPRREDASKQIAVREQAVFAIISSSLPTTTYSTNQKRHRQRQHKKDITYASMTSGSDNATIQFDNCVPGQTLVHTLRVQNITPNTVVLRIAPPLTQAFTIKHSGTGRLHPGLILDVEVRFTVGRRFNAQQHDRILLITGEAADTIIRVPIAAFAKLPKIQHESSINFGILVPGHAVRKYVTVRNVGPVAGSVRIDFSTRQAQQIDEQKRLLLEEKGNNSDSKAVATQLENEATVIVVEPDDFILTPGMSKRVLVELRPERLGPVRLIGDVTVEAVVPEQLEGRSSAASSVASGLAAVAATTTQNGRRRGSDGNEEDDDAVIDNLFMDRRVDPIATATLPDVPVALATSLIDVAANVLVPSLRLIPRKDKHSRGKTPVAVITELPHAERQRRLLVSGKTPKSMGDQRTEAALRMKFGNVYFGKRQVFRTYLVNNGPKPCTFVVSTSGTHRNGGGAGDTFSGADERTQRHLRQKRAVDEEEEYEALFGDGDDVPNHTTAGSGAVVGPKKHFQLDTPSAGDPIIRCVPLEGRIDAFDRVELRFIFAPRAPSREHDGSTGFQCKLNREALSKRFASLIRIEALENRFTLLVPVSGTGIEPILSFSQREFQFGHCNVNDRRDMFFTLTNRSSVLPISFKFSKVAHFRVAPREGTLIPLGEVHVCMSFIPHNRGVYDSTISMAVNGGSRTYDMRVSGKCEGSNPPLALVGGIDKTAVDFAPKLSVIDYEKSPRGLGVLPALVKKKAGHGGTRQRRRKSQLLWTRKAGTVEYLQQYTGRYALDETSFENVYTFSADELEARAENREVYAQFSQQQRERRLRKSGAIPQNGWSGLDLPVTSAEKMRLRRGVTFKYHGLRDVMNVKPQDPVTLGMRFASGCVSPRPGLPPKQEKLQLQFPIRGYRGGVYSSQQPTDGAEAAPFGGGMVLADAANTSAVANLMAATGNMTDSARRRLHVSMAGRWEPASGRKLKKFKCEPVTQAERQDCEAKLSHKQLECIITGRKVLDFGRLCQGSKATCSFPVTNGLKSRILVKILVDDEITELKSTIVRSQVIPAGETANFKVSFFSKTPCDFRRNVHYTINGRHHFTFVCVAEVVPVSLELSTSSLHFDFDSDNSSFCVKRSLVVRNTWSVPIEYWWSHTSDSFRVVPEKGTLPPASSTSVAVYYEPECAEIRYSTDVVLNIKNGKHAVLQCHAEAHEARCTFRHRHIDFGALCVGVRATRKALIRNVGKRRGVFHFVGVPDGVRVSPMRGVIEVGTSLPISVTLLPSLASANTAEDQHEYGSNQDASVKADEVPVAKGDKIGLPSFSTINHTLSVRLRGRPANKLLRLELRADAVRPRVEISQDEVSFGGVAMGSTAERMITVCNQAPVVCVLFLDLSTWREFGISYDAGWDDLASPPIVRVSPWHASAALSAGDKAYAGALEELSAGLNAVDDDTDGWDVTKSLFGGPTSAGSGGPGRLDSELGAVWRISVAPQAELSFHLTYSPRFASTHTFNLPLMLVGDPHCAGLRRTVVARGLRPRVSVSQRTVDFGLRVVLKTDMSHRRSQAPYSKSFTIKNEELVEVRWSCSMPAWHGDVRDRSGDSKYGDSAPSSGAVTTIQKVQAKAAAEAGDHSVMAKQQVFRIQPSSGRLMPGQTADITVFFAPSVMRNYTVPVSVFVVGGKVDDFVHSVSRARTVHSVSGENTTTDVQSLAAAAQQRGRDLGVSLSEPQSIKPDLQITLMGQGARPRFSFDVQEVVLGTVLVGVKATSRFVLINQGYENLDLKHELPDTIANGALSISYPDGSVIGVTRPRVPVDVTFVATKPTSFCVRLHFFGADGEIFTVPVSGSADSCLLSTYPYLMSKRVHFKIVRRPMGSFDWVHEEDVDPVVGQSGRTNGAVIDNLESKVDGSVDDAVSSAFSSHPQSRALDHFPKNARNGGGDGSKRHQHHSLSVVPKFMAPVALNGVSEAYAAKVMVISRRSVHKLLQFLFALNLIPTATVPRGPSAMSVGFVAKTDTDVPWVSEGRDGREGDAPTAGDDAVGDGYLSSLRFPAAFCGDNGKLLRDLIHSLSGRSLDSVEVLVGPNAAVQSLDDDESGGLEMESRGRKRAGLACRELSKVHATMQVCQRHVRALTYLRGRGALLDSIRGEDLLTFEQYQCVHSSPQFPGYVLHESVQARKVRESAFAARSYYAWATVLYQLVKLFILGRVTVKQLLKLPGVHIGAMTVADSAMSQSNVYSVGECVLLNWLQHHYDVEHPGTHRIVSNFDADLRDGLVLAAVLNRHVPGLQSTARMNNEVQSIGDYLSNANRVLGGVKEIGLTFDISDSDIAQGDGRDLLLFVLFLFLRLPSYIPRRTIVFSGKLHQEIWKSVKLNNPGRKPIVYEVRVEGSSDFVLDEKQVLKDGLVTLAPRGQPGSRVELNIGYRARFFHPVQGRLTLAAANSMIDHGGAGGSFAIADTQVFLLRSDIVSRQPLKTHEMTTMVYVEERFDIALENTLGKDAVFYIHIELDGEPPVPDTAKALKGEMRQRFEAAVGAFGGKTKHHFNAKRALQPYAGLLGNPTTDAPPLPPPFFCRLERIKVRAGQVAHVPMQFLPCRLGSYSAQVVFLDDRVGEVMHRLMGTSTEPPAIVTTQYSMSATKGNNKAIEKGITIPFKNAALDRARLATVDRMNSLSRRARAIKKTEADWKRQVIKPDLLPSAILYRVSCDSPYFKVPATFVLRDPLMVRDLGDGEGGASATGPMTTNGSGSRQTVERRQRSRVPDAEVNRLPLRFFPGPVGNYKANVVLESMHDIRCVNVECQLVSQQDPPTIEMRCAARQRIAQQIPIINPTEEAWSLRATMSGQNFHGVQELLVPPKSEAMYTVSFRPKWACHVEGHLELSYEKRHFHFHLLGIADEPLAEEMVSLTCRARQQRDHRVEVRNYDNLDIVYAVACDLEGIMGPSKLAVPARQSAWYHFSYTARTVGTSNGTITFSTQDGDRYVWFGLELKVEGAVAEREIRVSCEARKTATVAVAVKLSDTLSTFNKALNKQNGEGGKESEGSSSVEKQQSVNFTVDIDGVDGFGNILSGPSQFLLHGGEGVYECHFSPQIAGVYRSGVNFLHDEFGEFRYDVVLEAIPPPVVSCPAVSSVIGNEAKFSVELSNSSSKRISVRGKILERGTVPHFRFVDAEIAKKLFIDAGECISVELCFSPSSIGHEYNARVSFESDETESYQFDVIGTGTAPSSPVASKLTSAKATSSHALVNATAASVPDKVTQEVANDCGRRSNMISSAAAVGDESSALVHPSSTKELSVVADTVELPASSGAAIIEGSEMVFQATLNQPSFQLFGFHNPFDKEIDVQLRIGGDGSSDAHVFTMQVGKVKGNDVTYIPRVTVPALSTLEVALKFVPTSICECTGWSLRIATIPCDDGRETESVSWNYPLRGVACMGEGLPPQMLHMRARESLEETLTLLMPGAAGSASGGASAYSVAVEVPSRASKLVARSVKFSVLRQHVEDGSGELMLSVLAEFRAMRPMDISGSLVVRSAVGGVWKYPLHLLADKPEVDDTIQIEANLNETTEVRFQLWNYVAKGAPFQAWLSLDTSPMFRLTSATKGTLPGKKDHLDESQKADSEGDGWFSVSFTPVEYGRPQKGMLVVQTEEMRWSFALVGTHVKYRAPPGSSRVVSRSRGARRATIMHRK